MMICHRREPGDVATGAGVRLFGPIRSSSTRKSASHQQGHAPAGNDHNREGDEEHGYDKRQGKWANRSAASPEVRSSTGFRDTPMNVEPMPTIVPNRTLSIVRARKWRLSR